MRRPLRPREGARLITVDGITDSIPGWAMRLGVTIGTIHARLAKGWSERRAVTTPPRQPRRRYRREQ
jgi:hypothetical protein